MNDIAIRTENLGKKYRLGVLSQQRYSKYEVLGFRMPMQRLWGILLDEEEEASANDFWALRDLDMEVKKGEVLGIVGKNGSGKSTLLKLLARVTEPSTGSAEITGQVGSLLEVGTGFHPELTGRQNVFLNGSIMGMTHDQIAKRFDQIVAFAEVEAFIDTPVKHYSSGMYMRLAFSVAAHMDSDILIVDEVLAVGDAHFQRKCLARIDAEVKSGKTVLFVSHNTSTIMQVCTRCVLFENGRLIESGMPQEIVESYISRYSPVNVDRQYDESNAPTSAEGSFRIWSFRVLDGMGNSKTHFDIKESIIVEMEWDVLVSRFPIDLSLSLRHESGVIVAVSVDNHDSPWRNQVMPVGRYTARCVIPADYLNEGMFMLDLTLTTIERSSEYATCADAASFYLVDDLEPRGVRGDWPGKWFTSILRPRWQWDHVQPKLIEDQHRIENG